MVTISGRRKKPPVKRGLEKYGHHLVDCVRKVRPYCKTNHRKGETPERCAQGICFAHLRNGDCAIDTVHKFMGGKRRAGPWKIKVGTKKHKH